MRVRIESRDRVGRSGAVGEGCVCVFASEGGGWKTQRAFGATNQLRHTFHIFHRPKS